MSKSAQPVFDIFKSRTNVNKTSPATLKLPVEEDEVVIIAEIPTSSKTANNKEKVFKYYSQDVHELELDRSGSGDADESRVFQFIGGDGTLKDDSENPITLDDLDDHSDSDSDEDIKLIFDNRQLLEQIDGKLKSIESTTQQTNDDKSHKQVSPILTRPNSKVASTRSPSSPDDHEQSIMILNSPDNKAQTSDDDDDMLCNFARTYDNVNKPKAKPFVAAEPTPKASVHKKIEDEIANRNHQPTNDNQSTDNQSDLLTRLRKISDNLRGEKRIILVDPNESMNKKKQKVSATCTSTSPVENDESKTSSESPSSSSPSSPQFVAKPTSFERSLSTPPVSPSIARQHITSKVNTSKHIYNQEEFMDNLNSIDAAKKSTLEIISKNKFARAPYITANRMNIGNKPVLTKELLNLPQKKAKLMLAKSVSNNQVSVNDTLTLTQSINLAKIENLARTEAFRKEQQKEVEEKLKLQNRQSNQVTDHVKVAESTSTVSEVRPEKRPHQATTSSTTLKKDQHTKKTATHGSKQAKVQDSVQTSKKNDVVGNILNEINKQKTDSEMARHQEQMAARASEAEIYVMENFYYRILKCNYNWLIEQDKYSNEKNFAPPPVVSDPEFYPLIDRYRSYDDYYKTMFPYLLCETWEEIFKIWKEWNMDSNKQAMAFESPMWLKSINKVDRHPELLLMTCQMVTKVNSKYFPNEDDIMRVKLNLGVAHKKELEELNLFAIVIKSNKLKNEEHLMIKCVRDFINEKKKDQNLPANNRAYSGVSPNKSTPINSLNNFHDQLVVYEVHMLIRLRNYVTNFQMKIEYDIIGSLSSSMRRTKALVSFQRSHLMKSILYAATTDTIFWVKQENSEKLMSLMNKTVNLSEYNESQQKVILESSSIIYPKEPKLYFIQGPPGTGKSHTIVGIINAMFSRVWYSRDKKAKEAAQEAAKDPKKPNTLQQNALNKKDFKVLICSPSNGGCDELTRRIKHLKTKSHSSLHMLSRDTAGFNIVRVGRPDSIHQDCQDIALDNLAKTKIEELVCRKHAEKSDSLMDHYNHLKTTEINLVKKINNLKLSSSNQNIVKEIEQQLEELRKKKKNFEQQLEKINNSGQSRNATAQERKKFELQAKEMILKDADIIICTLNFCGNQILDCLSSEKNNGCSLVSAIIIDEAAQCLEVDSFIPLKFGCNKIIQVGDPEQLPATILSKMGQEKGFGMSLFERIYQRFKFNDSSNNPIRMLSIQYRMHPEICQFPSKNFYKGKLLTKKETELKRTHPKLQPYLIFNIINSQEVGDEQNGSVYNQIEADQIVSFCKFLTKKQTSLSIGIITPYQKQLQHLKKKLGDLMNKIEVGTVDGFQGREKDIVIFSSVRAKSQTGTIGFLSHRQRLNVALTRAKFGLYIFCDIKSLQVNEDWRNCIEDAKSRNLIIHVT